MPTDAVQIITTALAVLGAVLGIYNAWRNWIQDRVRIRVGVSLGQFTAGGEPFWLIECVNLSSFPVTVTHIGFDHFGGKLHAQLLVPSFVDNTQRLPVRLAPRTSATAMFTLTAARPEDVLRYRRAYIKTACGVKRTSSARKFQRLKLAIAPKG